MFGFSRKEINSARSPKKMQTFSFTENGSTVWAMKKYY
jgi:hypothetical protein